MRPVLSSPHLCVGRAMTFGTDRRAYSDRGSMTTINAIRPCYRLRLFAVERWADMRFADQNNGADPAHGESHSPSSKQTIEVTGEPSASIETHRSFRTSERLAPFAIFSSVCFSAASNDSACDRAWIFGDGFDSDSDGCAALAASLKCTSVAAIPGDS
jgi:hypothetical protein